MGIKAEKIMVTAATVALGVQMFTVLANSQVTYTEFNMIDDAMDSKSIQDIEFDNSKQEQQERFIFKDTIVYTEYSEEEKKARQEEQFIKDIEERSTVKYWYDELKEDDFIENPYYYDNSYELSEEERQLVEQIVMHESGWCPDYRICILTAQCVRNDCELNGWRPAEVFEKCGYAKMDWANARAVKAVQDVFDKGIKCVDEDIFCYYNCNLVDSPYHESNNLAIDIDGNRFFY